MATPGTPGAGWHPLAEGNPPGWASGWGQDRHGVFVEIAIRDATQRLRWIPTGDFMMGSPEDEPGRWDDEGPRHRVTIGQGFWLFDTPCTQALWVAVMEDNPSRFRTPDRPVERVSWKDATAFLERINGLVPGLALSLPSEAQWEYACRAGTDTALYSGPMEILGERNAPALDSIAWYAGNSGVEYELEDGEDSARWLKTQHLHGKAGTHPVGRKQPNAWGLYDMLGNVSEWCGDGWYDSHTNAPADGSARIGPREARMARVTRGGSWISVARGVRAAYRNRHSANTHRDRIGFRCAQLHP